MIFDLDATSLSAVAEKIADELLNKNEIRASDRDGLLRALLQRRRLHTELNMIFFLSTNSKSQKNVCSIQLVLILILVTVSLRDLWLLLLETLRCRPSL